MIAGFLALALTPFSAQLPPREPINSLSVDGRYVAINGDATFLVGQMSPRASEGRSIDDIARIVDVMMVPYGMNLWVGSFGSIDFGAWNERVNVRRGLQERVHEHEYPWLRTGPGETTFSGPRFDLRRFDHTYFDTLHARLKLLNHRGIVPVVGLFSEHAIDHPLHWRGHPFHPANNINALGLPADRAIPEFFNNASALEYQEAYVRRLLECLEDIPCILRPFGEAKRSPDHYLRRWLNLLQDRKSEVDTGPLVCLSGASQLLDRFAPHPAVDLIDVYCYHGGQYDARKVNVPEGKLGITATVREARKKYGKPVGKLYHKYGYPYADAESPWADPDTGTEGGGPPTAARDALWAVYNAGGFGCFFKMAWRRDRGRYLKPDLWSTHIRQFWQSLRGDQQ